MGVLDFLKDFCNDVSTAATTKRRRPMQTVAIKVKMDCDGCERRVRHAVRNMRGVKLVDVNRKQSKVSVTGYVDSAKVLNKVRSTGKTAEMWPYIEHNLVAYPYVAQAYDKKAPSGYVRNVVQAVPSPSATDQMLISLFSDDNPHACVVM